MPCFDRITFDPKIMAGKACIRGRRVTVALVLNLVVGGLTSEEIIRDYPYLEREDIRQALFWTRPVEDTALPLETDVSVDRQ